MIKKWMSGLVCLCILFWCFPAQAVERYLTKKQTVQLERLIASGEYGRCIGLLGELRNGHEGDYQFWMYLGICNAGLKSDLQEAENNYLLSLSLCREQREIYEVKYYLAVLADDMGRYDVTREICLEALERVRRWKPGARERYEALLNRSDMKKQTQKMDELQRRGDWPEQAKDTLPVPVLVRDTVLLAAATEPEDLALLEASAEEMLQEMKRDGKKVESIADLLPFYDDMVENRTQEKNILPARAVKKFESAADRYRWEHGMKMIIGKDTVFLVQGNDSLISVVKRIAKVQQEEGGELVYVLPEDWAIEAAGLERLLDKRVTVMIYEVFDFNKVYMNARGRLFMDKLSELMVNRPDMHFEISVHCDGIGTRDVNRRVATMRMVGINNQIEHKKMSAGRIKFSVWGSDRPRQVTARESELYPFLKVGDVLTMEFLRLLTVEQRRTGHMLNRRVEIRKID